MLKKRQVTLLNTVDVIWSIRFSKYIIQELTYFSLIKLTFSHHSNRLLNLLYKEFIINIIIPTLKNTIARANVLDCAKSKNIKRTMQIASAANATYRKWCLRNTILITKTTKLSITHNNVSKDLSNVQKRNMAVQMING